ncbi:MAG: putative zinc-binding metallopeptidase [Actinobacteria bacterium]|nr:putative zinc-binding metallopeptidase [Actinomycetota bacterium]
MRAFSCGVCGNLLVAENSVCVSCGAAQGFSPAVMRFLPVDVASGAASGAASGGAVQCVNLAAAGCNWLVDDGHPGRLCVSCRLTRTRPNDEDAAAVAVWASTESAKRRLVYQLLDLGLPVVPRSDDARGLAFDLLSSARSPVVTGHADGVVTIDLAEGHDAHREAMRVQMGEPYRTMLGHLRHEVGHYYWQVLVRGNGLVGDGSVGSQGPPSESPALQRFRHVFGDERADYRQALQRHYATGPPRGWAAGHVSAYATAHPWEDWAETFAHYLHIRDTLQSAAAYGMVVTGPEEPGPGVDLVALPLEDAAAGDTIGSVVGTWLPLTYALNAVNRSMGKGDLYPFVLTPPVISKLGVVHDLVVGVRV